MQDQSDLKAACHKLWLHLINKWLQHTNVVTPQIPRRCSHQAMAAVDFLAASFRTFTYALATAVVRPCRLAACTALFADRLKHLLIKLVLLIGYIH